MAVDAGAQLIADLLNRKTPALNQNLAKLARAAKNAHNNPYGVMSQSGVEALADLQQFYRSLRTQIAAIETADGASKASALQALDSLDGAFGAYERGLEFGISRPAVPKLKNAERKSRLAKRKLNGALGGLSG